MPLLPSVRTSGANRAKGRADHLYTQISKDLNSKQAAFHSETSTDAPEFQAGIATRLQSRCYLFEYAKKQLIRKHEKPVYDEYSKDLNELQKPCGGALSDNDGAIDQNALEEAAKTKLQAGLKAVQPTIAEELHAMEDLITSEYQPLVRKYEINQTRNRLATLKRDNKSRARKQPLMFTRAEVAEADEVWKAKRTALGLPLEGDLDDLEPGEIVREQNEDVVWQSCVLGEVLDLDSSAEEEDWSMDSSVEGQFDDGDYGNPMEIDSENEELEPEPEQEEEVDASESPFSRRPRNS